MHKAEIVDSRGATVASWVWADDPGPLTLKVQRLPDPPAVDGALAQMEWNLAHDEGSYYEPESPGCRNGLACPGGDECDFDMRRPT